jgi:hypothetical protein
MRRVGTELNPQARCKKVMRLSRRLRQTFGTGDAAGTIAVGIAVYG